MRARRVALRQRWISSVRTSAGLWAHVSLTLWEPRAPFRFPSSHCTLETPRTVRCDGPSRGRRTYAWVTHDISHRLVTSTQGHVLLYILKRGTRAFGTSPLLYFLREEGAKPCWWNTRPLRGVLFTCFSPKPPRPRYLPEAGSTIHLVFSHTWDRCLLIFCTHVMQIPQATLLL